MDSESGIEVFTINGTIADVTSSSQQEEPKSVCVAVEGELDFGRIN